MIIAAVLAAAAPAWADDPPVTYEDPLPGVGEAPGAEVGERELSGSVGVAFAAGDLTPGGFRIGGSYLYQLADVDWFDGGVAFTYGGGGPACFRDRADELICDQGTADGAATDLFAGVRRFFGGQGAFRPWVRPTVGARIVRFSDDDLTGFGAVATLGGGVRARVAERIAVGAHAQLEAGAGYFNRDLGWSPMLGMAIGIDVDVTLP